MELAVILISILVVLGCAGYFYLMIYHPEWVGITGPAARKTLAEHAEGSVVDDRDLFSSEEMQSTDKPTPKND